jgi:hypothetical protein
VNPSKEQADMTAPRRRSVLFSASLVLLIVDASAESEMRVVGGSQTHHATHNINVAAHHINGAVVTPSGDAQGEYGVEMRTKSDAMRQKTKKKARWTSQQVNIDARKRRQVRISGDAHDERGVTGQERAHESDSHAHAPSMRSQSVVVDAGGASVDAADAADEQRSALASHRLGTLEKAVDATVSDSIGFHGANATRPASLPALTSKKATKSAGLAGGVFWAVLVGVPLLIVLIVGLYIFARYRDRAAWLATRPSDG